MVFFKNEWFNRRWTKTDFHIRIFTTKTKRTWSSYVSFLVLERWYLRKQPRKRSDKIPITIMCSCLCFRRHFLISQSIRTATRKNPIVYHYFCLPLLIVRTYINDKSAKWTVYRVGNRINRNLFMYDKWVKTLE